MNFQAIWSLNLTIPRGGQQIQGAAELRDMRIGGRTLTQPAVLTIKAHDCLRRGARDERILLVNSESSFQLVFRQRIAGAGVDP
jgi:hypothetical protein